jgi:hypothetical protein
VVTVSATKLNIQSPRTFPTQFIRVFLVAYRTKNSHSPTQFKRLVSIMEEQYVLCAIGIELYNTGCFNCDALYTFVSASRPRIAERLNGAYRATWGEERHRANTCWDFRGHGAERSLCQPLTLCLVLTIYMDARAHTHTHIHVPYFIWQLSPVTSRRYPRR